jgi:hypothetical protein
VIIDRAEQKSRIEEEDEKVMNKPLQIAAYPWYRFCDETNLLLVTN